jgi:hypothetical protein
MPQKKVYISSSNKLVEYMDSKLPKHLPLDNLFGFLIGVYLAKGQHTNTHLSILNNPWEISVKIEKFCGKYGLRYNIVPNIYNRDIHIYSMLLVKVVKTICGTGVNKKIPELAYTAPMNFISGLIDGYVSRHATVNNKTGYLVVGSSSKDIILGLATLLNFYGIFSVFENTFIKYNILTIRNGFAQIFMNRIPVTSLKIKEKLTHVTGRQIYKHFYGKRQKNLPHDRNVYFDAICQIQKVKGTCEYVYDLTVEETRNFQLWNGLVVRDTFHRAGSADKQPVVSKFSELLNATSKPKAPSYFIYFRHGHTSVPELRKTIGHSLVQLSLKHVTKYADICVGKTDEKWYEAFWIMNGKPEKEYKHCLSLRIDMDILFEYKLTLKTIVSALTKEYADLYCIYSPDCFGKIDVFVDTKNIEIPEEKIAFITEENKEEMAIAFMRRRYFSNRRWLF